ncbi:MAG: DNA translocase FtsK [Caldilineaceae bacterium]|nr:DNA translocase FtsK [Caldilineaceae bacterium]
MGWFTPRYVQFKLTVRPGTKISKVTALSEELALALGSPGLRIARQQGCVNIEMLREKSDPVRLLPLIERLDAVPPHSAILGVEELGAPLLLRLTAPDVAHVLVAGTTGSGKTALARTLLCSLAMFNPPDELSIILVDPKGRGFGPLSALPHVKHGIISEPDEAVARLGALGQEMERRDHAGVSRPVIVVAVDEIADIYQTGGSDFEKALGRIAQRGRQAGIHLIGCTQKPTASLIGSSVIANFPVRLVGAVASKDEARYATGVTDSGAEKLAGSGDFLLVSKGELVRFQAAWLGPEDMKFVSEMLHRPELSRWGQAVPGADKLANASE